MTLMGNADQPWLTGPGNCTILLAGKTSPTAVRGQFYGIAAAVGKLGAFVGTWGRFVFESSTWPSTHNMRLSVSTHSRW